MLKCNNAIIFTFVQTTLEKRIILYMHSFELKEESSKSVAVIFSYSCISRALKANLRLKWFYGIHGTGPVFKFK